MSSMNDNDDDGNIRDFSLPAGAAAIGRAAAVGVVGGGGTTTSFPPHGSNAAAAASASSAAWNDFGYSHAATRSNPTTNLSNDDDGVLDGIGMAASSSTTTPSMDDLQIHDHPMVSFSDTGGMGMAVAVAGGTTTNYFDESNEYYGDRMMMQHNRQQQQQQQQDVAMKFPPSPNSITANNNNINNSSSMLNEELNFHPDLPFLVTHWLSTFVPPPPPTTSTTTSSSTIISTTCPRQLATLPADDATKIDVLDDKRNEALKLIRHHASSLANAFQTLGAFGLSSSSSGTITHRSSTSSSIVGTQAISSDSAATFSSTDSLPCFYRPTTYADMTRKYSQLLNVAIPSTHGIIMEERSNNLSTHGYCLDRNGNRLGALLGTLVGASTREGGDMRNDSMKKGSTSNSIRNTPWSLLEASYEGLVSLLHQAEDGTERCNNSAIVPAVVAAAASSSTTTTANGEKRKGNSRSAKSTSFGLPGRKVGEHTPSSSSSSLMDAIHKGTNAYILSSGDIITSSMAGDNAHNADASLHYSAASIRAAVASRSYQKIRMDVHSQRKEVECNLMALQQSTKKQSELLVGDLGVFGGSGGSFGEPESNDPQRIVAHLNNRRATLQSKYVSTKAALAVVEREAKQLYKESTSIRRQYHDAYKMNGQPTSLHQILHDKSGSVNLGYGPSAHAPGKNNLVLPAILSRQYHPRHKLSSVSRTRLSVLKARLSHASTISCHLIYPVYCLKFDKTGKYFITGADDQVAKVFHLGAGPRRAPPVTTTTTFGDQYPALPFNYGANVRGAVLVCSLRGHAGVISDLDVSSDNSLLATASGDGDVRIWGLKDGWPVATLRGHKGGANWVSWSLLSPYRVVTCGDDGYARMWDVRGAAEKRNGTLQPDSEPNGLTHHGSTLTLQHNIVPLPVQQENASGTSANANVIGIELQRTYGEFVFNQHIDDGVTLMASLQHSSTTSEEASLRSTRTAGKEVRVMCISRCPLGGHFATGSDDGVGRVWVDDDDWLVESQDCEFDPDDGLAVQYTKQRTLAPRVPPRDRLLAVLRGHNKPITEIKYSSAGDRLLTASEDDGNVCLWSGFPTDVIPSRFSNVSKLCIDLNSPSYGGQGTKVRCDGVAWTCDDLKIVSSQSVLASANGIDIVPESHMLHVWDSYSGKCLMGITNSHSSISIALAPHPFLPSVVALAGLDGCVNVWDLDRGDCFYTHINTLLHGPVEPITDRGQRKGCIEVQFSPDGLNLVVTDVSGRATILDTHVPAWLRIEEDKLQKAELSEQYFANDYYELAYDANGYCIEKGSEQPPHLAPGGVRCSYEGVPVPERMRELFLQLKGPLSLPPNSAVWCRNEVRSRGTQSRLDGGIGRKYPSTQVKRVAASRYESTVILTKDGSLVKSEAGYGSNHNASSSTRYRNYKQSKAAATSLSSRYNWVDYNDLVDSEDDVEDQFDNDYHGIDESSEEDNSSPYRQRGQTVDGRHGSRRTRRNLSDEVSPEHRRPARASSRQATQRAYNELSSDDDNLQEMMSAHTKPSGKYVDDWEVSGHMYKLPRGGGSLVHRSWLHRTSYQGRKCYCPQVGDTVVYVPKAHEVTLQRFPINDYSPPWRSWPTATSWPVVLCKVSHVRYRFPYEMNYKSRRQDEKLMGVSTILTLEIVGVPSRSSGRDFPWPAPTFISPTDKRTRFGTLKEFDVTLFQSDEDEFLIPEHIYSWRLKELERAIRDNGGNVEGLPVTVSCPPDSSNNGVNTEDADYVTYSGRLVRINETIEDEFHLRDSGYNALSLEWDTQDNENNHDLAGFSVWSINIAFPSCDAPIAPTMGEQVTNSVREALRSIIRMDSNVSEWFFEQVDTTKFTDYLDMVEVPIHISLIQKRLRSNYYTNKLSVIADLEQLMDNCYKYNGDDNDFYDLACEIYDRFKSLVDAIEEPPTFDIDHMTAEEINDHAVESIPAAHAQDRSRIEGASDEDGEQSQQAQSIVNGRDKLNEANKRRPVRGRSEPLEDVQHSRSQRSSERKHPVRATRSKQIERKSENDVDSDCSSEKDNRNDRVSSSRASGKTVPAEGAYEREVGSRRKSSRTKIIPSYCDRGSEEEDGSEDSAESENGEDSESEDDSDGDVPAVGRNTRTRSTRKMPSRDKQEPNKSIAVRRKAGETNALRISLRAKSKPMYAENDSDEDDSRVDVSVPGAGNRKLSGGKKTSSNTRLSQRQKRKPIENSGRRLSSRARLKTESLEGVGSENSSEDESVGEASAAKENTRNGRPSRASNRSSYFEKDCNTISDSQVIGRRMSPRAKSARKVYADIDSYSESRSEDEGESESEDDSTSEEEETNRNSRKRGLRHSDASAKKRARTQRHSTKIQTYPELEKWKSISKRKIFSIGNAILGKLRELDTLDLFSAPVLEIHPSLAAAYNKVVKVPMDFKTIETKRMPFYTHIADLQDDLILTFRNCCEFNGEMTEYYNYAIVIWEMLNDVYDAALEEKY